MSTTNFHRSARVFPERLPNNEIVLIAPQSPPKQQTGPLGWLQSIIPVVGSLTSVMYMMISFSRSGGSSLYLVGFIGVFMLVSSVGGGMLMRHLQRRTVKQQYKAYHEKFFRYLSQQTMRLEDIEQRQKRVMQRLFPKPNTLPTIVQERKNLWERRPTDEDFLLVRIGKSIAPLCCPIKLDVNTTPLADYDPILLARAQGIMTRFENVDDIPVTLPLGQVGSIAINGDRDAARALTRAMLTHLAAFHAPDDVRFLIVSPPDAIDQWSWAKWLPHARCIYRLRDTTDGFTETACMLAATVADFEALVQSQIKPAQEWQQKNQAEQQNAHQTSGTLQQGPHFVVIIDGYSPRHPINQSPLLNAVFAGTGSMGLSVISLVNGQDDEPSVLGARLAIDAKGMLTYSQTAFGGNHQNLIHADTASHDLCEQVARGLAPLSLKEQDGKKDLLNDIRLLDLQHVAAAERLDVSQAWSTRARDDLLRVPIGMSADGTPLILDFKEAAEGGMGPHGLIIGATGSGKSELLRTIISSLALTHDPTTLNFVLADFKGGASFAALAQLPHSAGLITNLQGDMEMVERTRQGLMGEIERRQHLLRDAGNLDNIRQYRLRAAQAHGLAPMPYLLIVVDEFAELLTLRPDFLELFTTIGRVGRSLGLYLLMATQRLGEGRIQGLEGHLRYRICLRTFSAAESKLVLGTNDAFYLPSQPGLGYFKVDTAIYRQFKTALISNPFIPKAETDSALSIREFTALGQLRAVKQGTRETLGDSPLHNGYEPTKTDMDMVIQRIDAEMHSTPYSASHQVVLPPLATAIALGPILKQHAMSQRQLSSAEWQLRIPIGIIDRPYEQVQDIFSLDFKGAEGHLAIIGAPQSGKSMLLQTIVAAFMQTHRPQEAQIYGIDLGGGRLRALEAAPHVGTICGKGERDKIRNMIRFIRAIIDEREYLFRKYHIDSIATYRARQHTDDLPEARFGDVFLIIDDIGQLLADFDQIDLELMGILTTGLAYGVHMIIASNRWGDIRPKLRESIGARLEMRLNDPSESEVNRALAMALAQTSAGRGLSKQGFFQVALPQVEAELTQPPLALQQSIDRLITSSRAQYNDYKAPQVLSLPVQLAYQDIAPPPAAVLLGVDELRLEPVTVDVTQTGAHFIILGDSESGKTNMLRLWLKELERLESPATAQVFLIDFRRTLIDATTSPLMAYYACTTSMLKEGITRIRTALEPRMMASTNITLQDLRTPRQWHGPRVYCLVDDYEGLMSSGANQLSPLLDLVLQGRDIGFHLIITRRVSGTSRTSFEPLYQQLREQGTAGLILSGDPQEGNLLGMQKALPQPAGRGFLVRRNQRTILIQAPLVE